MFDLTDQAWTLKIIKWEYKFVENIKLVDEYNVIIEEEFQQTYKDFKEQAVVINKENDANSFAEKLAQEIVLEKKTDEYGDLMYTQQERMSLPLMGK